MESHAGEQHTAGATKDIAGVETLVTVDYLPATEPFRQAFPATSTLEAVRAAAMQFFGVRDRTERDTYAYFLEFEGSRVTDTSKALSDLPPAHKKGVHFHLIEQVTPGAIAR